MRFGICALLALLAAALPARAQHRLPFLGEEARKRGYELPLTYGIGLVYYKLQRDIEVTDVRVGRNDGEPVSVSEYVVFAADSDVDNLNVKADVWILPFLNLYAIAGTIKNQSTTRIAVTLPPVLPGGSERHINTTVPTKIDGSVGGLGITLAGGVGHFLGALDVNVAKADLGFDDRFQAIVASARAGWHGKAGNRPLRLWVNTTYWDTYAEAKGSVVDPDGGTLHFEVDQGPASPWTYGVGGSYAPRPWLEFSADAGFDFQGGWYIALVPVYRF